MILKGVDTSKIGKDGEGGFALAPEPRVPRSLDAMTSTPDYRLSCRLLIKDSGCIYDFSNPKRILAKFCSVLGFYITGNR